MHRTEGLVKFPIIYLRPHGCTYERRTDRGPPVVGKHGEAFRRSSPCDLPPTATPLRGPMKGTTRRAHLVGTTSGSNSTSHAILLSWPIVCRFPPPKLLRKPRYDAFHLFAKTPWDDPTKYPPHQYR